MTLQRLAKWHLPIGLGLVGLAAAWWPVVQPMHYDDGGMGALQFALSSTLGWTYGVGASIVSGLVPEAPEWLQGLAASAMGLLPFLVAEWLITRRARILRQ